jgi:hypothetical protein
LAESADANHGRADPGTPKEAVMLYPVLTVASSAHWGANDGADSKTKEKAAGRDLPKTFSAAC